MNQEQKFLAIIICLLLSVTNIAPVIHRFLSIFIKRLLKKILSFHLFRKKDEIILGPIRISDRDRIRHTHIVGATGSGKTLLMESLIYEDLKNGRGALIIDPKGDRELYERIKEFCEKIGRISDLHLVSAQYKEESVRWNPCRLGSASEIQSKFLNAWVFSESFYEKACESALLEAINNVLKEKEYFHLPDLVSYIKKNTTKSKNIEALFLDFNNLIESEWKEILCASPPKLTKKEINFLDITRKNEIIFLDLPTEGKSVQSSKIGRLFLQEIILISGLRKIFPSLRSQTPFPIYIDVT